MVCTTYKAPWHVSDSPAPVDASHSNESLCFLAEPPQHRVLDFKGELQCKRILLGMKDERGGGDVVVILRPREFV